MCDTQHLSANLINWSRAGARVEARDVAEVIECCCYIFNAFP